MRSIGFLKIGCRKPWNHNIQHLNTEQGPFSIPFISTTSTSRLARQDKPKGSNSNKTLPKLKSDITSGTNVCLWNARSTRNKSVELTDYICENDVDIMIIVQSWLKDSDDVVIGECTPRDTLS